MCAVSQQVELPPRYRVVRHIANGGMATVWAAEDSLLERLVAVKVLAAGYAADPAARRRFTREARAAARVSDHANVVTIFDIGDHDGQAFIVMEHFPGGTVADRLRSGDPIPVPLALRWLRETASALDAAHAADVVHRDVKPGNLLLDANGRLGVGDFGIASLAGETAVTAAGQVLGTAAYLSPEQARGHGATAASDRYSLAVVAYELLCGERPFPGDTAMAQARARVEREPTTPSGPCGTAADALKHGLARDPADRPATATAFVAELTDVLGDAAHPTRTTTVMPSRRATGPEWADRDRPRFARPSELDATAPHALPDEPRAPRDDRRASSAAPDAPPTEPRRSARPIPVPVPSAAAAEARARADTAPPVRRDPPPDPVARPRSPHRNLFILAFVALVCVAFGAGTALLSDNGNNGGKDPAAPKATASKSQGAPTGGVSRAATPDASSTPTSATPAPSGAQPDPSSSAPADTSGDSRSAAEINNAGFAMLPSNPQGALPLLSAAVAKFRAAGDTKSTDYAYSLYNYGWALRLAGRPADAIPYLQERLRISDYKRDVVEQELRTAQTAAGVPPTAGTASTKGHGNHGKSAGGPGKSRGASRHGRGAANVGAFPGD
jgi:serine/threonine-protein kinase